MNQELVQTLRYKLQKRVKRLNVYDNHKYEHYHYGILQFWQFLNSKEIFKGLMLDIENRFSKYAKNAEVISNCDSQGTLLIDNEQESAATSYFVIKKCVESESNQLEYNIGRSILGGYDTEHAIENFQEYVIEPFYEYLDEQLDDQKVLLALLKKYKHKSEWFNRDRLHKLWSENTQKGEKLLALDLYEYLHEQGIEFMIEPFSISGEIDLVKIQTDEEPLIADAKIFNPEKDKSKPYLMKGLRQIYDYTMDYNESFGYLIIYKTCEESLNLSFSNKESLIPFVTVNNKTIYFVVIDIFPYKTSASKRGKLKTIEILESELIEYINDDK